MILPKAFSDRVAQIDSARHARLVVGVTGSNGAPAFTVSRAAP